MPEHTIFVQAVKRDRKVIVAENNDEHPGGVAWVCGDERVYEVARTPDIARALADKRIVEVARPANATAAAERQPDPLTAWPELRDAGYTTVEQVASADDAALLALEGIDSRKLKEIRKVAPKAA